MASADARLGGGKAASISARSASLSTSACDAKFSRR
jgi:hypothetical protein